MSIKPENQFISGVHKHLKGVHHEKMCNPWRAGTADVWYSGSHADLWIEYKYVERIPRSQEILPDLTPRQRRWLGDRYAEGRNVAVVLGSTDGGVIYRDQSWLTPLSMEELISQLVPRERIARWIADTVGTTACLSTIKSTGRPKR